jgi:hypothetical protein
MHKDTLRNFSANHLYRRHSSDLRSYFGDYSFCFIVKKAERSFKSGINVPLIEQISLKPGYLNPNILLFFM